MSLNIPIDYLLLHYKEDREAQRLKRKYLEMISQGFVDNEKWESFGDVLALVIFGLVLFPNMDNFIDYTVISVFWNVNNQVMNPVPALFVDVYYTLCTFHGKKKGLLCCCIHLLYSWIGSHLYEDI